MTDEERQTQAAAPPRRAPAAGRPLGTLLLAKVLDLTPDEAAQLRADVAEARSKGARVMLSEVVAGMKDGARRWLGEER